MGRPNRRDEVTQAVREYLAIAVCHPPEKCPLDVASVAAAVDCVRSSIYNYGLQQEIAEAAQQQQRLHKQTGSEKSDIRMLLRQLRAEIKLTEQRNRHLLERLILVEGNAARLGIDTEELFKPLPKPIRMVSHAGRGRKPSR